MASEKTATETATQGIMTTEVGAITGPVEIITTRGDAGVDVTVAYEGADEAYTVKGSPAPAQESHEDIVAALVADTGKATHL